MSRLKNKVVKKENRTKSEQEYFNFAPIIYGINMQMRNSVAVLFCFYFENFSYFPKHLTQTQTEFVSMNLIKSAYHIDEDKQVHFHYV